MKIAVKHAATKVQQVAESQGLYTTQQVSRLAGIPTRTLYDWKQRGILRPSLQLIENGEVVDEGYSYADLTLARLIRALRDKQLDFSSAARALHHLYERLGPPNRGWANERVYLLGNRVFVDRPDEWEATDASALGQKVITTLFGDLFDELRDADEGASIIVPPHFRQYVQVNPSVMGGEPVIRDTRLPTATVRAMLERYGSIQKLASLYSPIPRAKLEKAVEYERYLDKRTA